MKPRLSRSSTTATVARHPTRRELRQRRNSIFGIVVLVAGELMGLTLATSPAARLVVILGTPALVALLLVLDILWQDRSRRHRTRMHPFRYCERCEYDMASGPNPDLCPECGWTRPAGIQPHV
jgi:hypothetical protein